MKKEQINIRDPFVVFEDGKYYLYGTRAENFGYNTGGFDVYVSTDLENWNEPIECFNSIKYEMNSAVNWAPEVHKYNGKYYMFATFTQPNGLKGTFSLISDNLEGPFVPHSKGALTPNDWECLDGTLFVDDDGVPYIVFCHEHIQIIDGTICYARLNENLDGLIGEVTTLFCASSCKYVSPYRDHYVTDGPFLFRSSSNNLFMIWSSFIGEDYAELIVSFKNGKLSPDFKHLDPVLDNDGGHGMIFSDGKKTYFIYHTPNRPGFEHPEFRIVEYNGNSINII